MPDQFVDNAQQNMDAVEHLIKGLPGVSGYIDKELRRDADKRLRVMIADALEAQKQRLFDVQKRLLSGGGLRWLDDVDAAIQKLQILIDRIKTASYGYAGFFDPVRIKAEQLNALHRFDVAMATETSKVEGEIDVLDAAIDGGEQDLGPVISQLTRTVADLNRLFGRRHEAILAPDMLTDEYAPIIVEEPSDTI
jgi:hypothetical protein